jgi:7-carboxy-7-deazaguanine synthase
MSPVPATMSSTSANMLEIFSSIQGEGIYVGVRQAFLRFHGCKLNCNYCDTRRTHSSQSAEYCEVEMTPGKRDFTSIKNPVTLTNIMQTFEKWENDSPRIHHSISITGGEPLLQSNVLVDWLPYLSSILPIYLETNGVLYNELSKCIGHIKYVSMDVKLPSVSGLDGLWESHLNFLRIASRQNVFVKVVVGRSTSLEEIKITCDLINSVDSGIPLVIQPFTADVASGTISPLLLLEFQEIASTMNRNVRIVPQTHVFMGFI